MTATDIETLDLTALDHEIPCAGLTTGPNHRQAGCGKKNPAEWAMWLRPDVCEHQTRDFMYFCNPCKEKYINQSRVCCPAHIHFLPPSEVVLRLERIK